MPYEIHLRRFCPNFKKEKKITAVDWNNCSSSLSNLKYVMKEENTSHSIQTFNAETKEWVPVFWLHDNGSGVMRSQGFQINYQKAYEIAEFLGAIIYGDWLEIYYLPKVGEIKEIEIKLDELREMSIKIDENFENNIKNLVETKIKKRDLEMLRMKEDLGLL